eukprot:6267594-Prymnesium_polylepis.1
MVSGSAESGTGITTGGSTDGPAMSSTSTCHVGAVWRSRVVACGSCGVTYGHVGACGGSRAVKHGHVGSCGVTWGRVGSRGAVWGH